MNRLSLSGISLAVLLALATLTSITFMQNANAQTTTPSPTCATLIQQYNAQKLVVAADQVAVTKAQANYQAAVNKLIADSSGLNALKPNFAQIISADTNAVIQAAQALAAAQAKLNADTNTLNNIKSQLDANRCTYIP